MKNEYLRYCNVLLFIHDRRKLTGSFALRNIPNYGLETGVFPFYRFLVYGVSLHHVNGLGLQTPKVSYQFCYMFSEK